MFTDHRPDTLDDVKVFLPWSATQIDHVIQLGPQERIFEHVVRTMLFNYLKIERGEKYPVWSGVIVEEVLNVYNTIWKYVNAPDKVEKVAASENLMNKIFSATTTIVSETDMRQTSEEGYRYRVQILEL